MMRRPLSLCLFAMVALLLVCPSTPAMDRLHVENGRIVDASGRTVVLHGMNVGEKSSANGHRLWQSQQDFNNLHRWGMNAVRLLIFWSAIEPEPGSYDEDYLKLVDQYVAWAKDAELYVILDMHQDLYSEKVPGGNGMPTWATLDDGQPHRTVGDIWSTAYYVSPMVHRAFDNLYANTTGPDGTGIQDRFAQAWRHVAQRYAEEPAVAGFDLINEPFIGSDITSIGFALLAALPEVFPASAFPTEPGALLDSLSGSGGPLPTWVLKGLDDPACHRRALNVIAPFMRDFETGRLMPMYNRISRAIREGNAEGIIFLEPCVLANVGTPSFLEPLTDSEGGRDPRQAYMPHFYDIVVDTDLAWEPSANRLRVMMGNRVEEAKRLDMPLLIGEWGGYYGSNRARNAARASLKELLPNTVGDFYWDYHRGTDKTAFFDVLSRPLPCSVNGAIEMMELDLDHQTFACSWRENTNGGKTSFFIPQAWTGAGRAWRTETGGNGDIEEAVDGSVITVPAEKPGEMRTLTIAVKQP
jgi:endoglycosylceramidase